jgi:hypothetical protein
MVLLKKDMKSKIKVNKTTTSFAQLGLALIVQIFLLSCLHHNSEQANTKKGLYTIAYPQRTVLANLSDSNKPVKIFLKDRPEPSIIATRSENKSINNKQRVSSYLNKQLSLPSVHTFVDTLTNLPIAADAQGKGFFITYCTDNGLALDTRIASVIYGLGLPEVA